MSRHTLKGHWLLSYKLGKREVQALDHLVWIAELRVCRVVKASVKMAIFPFGFQHSDRCSAAVQMAGISPR